MSSSFWIFLPILLISSRSCLGDIDCLDKKTTCDDDSTCCLMLTGSYGCCPMRRAVCCSDKIHCCPEGTSCNVKRMQCDKPSGGIPVPIVAKISAKKKKQQDVQCMDHKTYCPPSTTCCPSTVPGHMSCCPAENAVCCSDRKHCCPAGTTCDESSGSCLKENQNSLILKSFVPWAKKIPAFVDDAEQSETLTCPDGKSKCKDGQTCCKIGVRHWGCCPLPNAVCCENSVHCCPENTTCDVEHRRCIKQFSRFSGPSFLPMLSTEISEQTTVSQITCADGKSKCTDGQTCCKTNTGSWGCCPSQNAVCCTDGIHCCPENTVCDLKHGRCIKNVNQRSGSAFLRLSSAGTSEQLTITCADGKSKCADGTTCCKIRSGWGCCPMPNAVCCTDGIHCCPENSLCDLEHGRCIKQHSSPPSGSKFMRLLLAENSGEWKTCDAKQKVKCPDKSTCCKMKTGKWGCCPMPQATCCSDGVHCCPHGTECDVEHGRCTHNDVRRYFTSRLDSDAFKMKPIVSAPDDNRDFSATAPKLCPDHIQQCNQGDTCCLGKNSTWSCCPFSEAVCCPDPKKPYCCPKGQKCGSRPSFGQSCVTI